MDLFIDTNVFLSFYHLSSDELEELRKLIVLLEQDRVTLHVPGQVRDEFVRNRDAKVADALKRMRDQKLPSQFPQICKDYSEYAELRQCLTECNEHLGRLLERLDTDVSARSLKADHMIDELFRYGRTIDASPSIVRAAYHRMQVGNPPGKAGSLGDAINWESLMWAVPEGRALHFISEDNDYASPLGRDQFNAFLMAEWSSNKKAHLRYYQRLSLFFKEHFPQIALATDLEKDLLIRDLASSSSFATSRQTLRYLARYSDFSKAQIRAFVDACLRNNQVFWIVDDHDINEMIRRISDGYESDVEPEDWRALQQLLEPLGEPGGGGDNEDPPF